MSKERTPETIYFGQVTPDRDYAVCVSRSNGEGGIINVPLPLRLDLRNHSPTGFAWGYMGSGPSQLALAILAHHTQDPERALAFYQQFKFDVIARLNKELGFTLPAVQVAAWLRKARKEAKV